MTANVVVRRSIGTGDWTPESGSPVSIRFSENESPGRCSEEGDGGERPLPTTCPADGATDRDAVDVDGSSKKVEDELLDLYETVVSVPESSRRGSFRSNRRLSIGSAGPDPPCEGPDAQRALLPRGPPEQWPQRPLLLRPSPESGMAIRGVRYSSSDDYMATPPGDWDTLPINNGTERPGRCLVIDFESEVFIGTAMLRIKKCPSLIDGDYKGSPGSYFDGRKRTFQGVVRGRFKAEISMSETVTGQLFNRPAGILPPRLVTKGAIGIISRLAPQLQARLDGDFPRFLSPLISTAQSVMSSGSVGEDRDSRADETLEMSLEEPRPSDPASLLNDLAAGGFTTLPSDSDGAAARIKTRKRAFDKLHADRSTGPTFDTGKEYTFEFFQHLILFDEFALGFPRPVGKAAIAPMLNGQPLKFVAAHQRTGDGDVDEFRWLWSFDIWHESLYQTALEHESVLKK
mmetsp:Transcript_36790/g.82761  ORF Transcript_36790/g.82761 Transcript_36790/m.82761 type:complete len:459 (-) Transcript_36790:313-1689(-)